MRWTLEKFREEYDSYTQRFGSDIKCLQCFYRFNILYLPSYPSDQFIPVMEVGRERYKGSQVKTVASTSLYGNTWLFRNEFNFGKPEPESLAYFSSPKSSSTILPVPVLELPNKKYFVMDGGHRLYVSYLRGWDTINVEVVGTIPFSKRSGAN